MSQSPPVICYEAEPSIRHQISETIRLSGCSVLSTGNAQIAAAMVRDLPLSCLVLSIHQVSLPTISILVESRRCKPELPVVVILRNSSRNAFPAGLADCVLESPSQSGIQQTIKGLIDLRHLASVG